MSAVIKYGYRILHDDIVISMQLYLDKVGSGVHSNVHDKPVETSTAQYS